MLLAWVGFLPGSLGLFRDWFLWIEDSSVCYRVWWFSRILGGGEGSIWFLPDVLYPVGLSTQLQSNGLGKELLFAALGLGRAPWLAGNLLAISTPVTVAVTGFLVTRRLFRGAFLPALVAGWYLGWTGTFLGHAVSPWMASWEGLVVFVWSLLMMRRRGGMGWALAAGVAAAFAIWLQIQQLVTILVLSFLYLLDRRMHGDWARMPLIGVSGLVALVLVFPLLLETWVAFEGVGAKASGLDASSAVFLWRNRPLQLVLPPPGSLPLGSVSPLAKELGLDFHPHPAPFLGWGVLVMAFVGWRTRHRGTGFLAAVAVIGAFLSFGPVISFGDPPRAPESVFGPSWIPGPYLLIQHIPILDSMRVPGRYVAITQIALALLAGYGVLRTLRRPECRRHPSIRYAFVGFLFLAHMLEFNLWPVRFMPSQHSAFYDRVAAESGEFAVLDMPYTRGMTNYMHYGAYHHKKVIWGFGSRAPGALFHPAERDFEFPGILQLEPKNFDPDYARFAESLVRYHVKYIILHDLHLNYNEEAQKSRAALLEVLENPQEWADQTWIHPPALVYQDDILRVYRVAPRSGPAPDPIPDHDPWKDRPPLFPEESEDPLRAATGPDRAVPDTNGSPPPGPR